MPVINKIDRINLIKRKSFELGGVCLDDVYLNRRSLMNFVCNNNHKFTSTSDRVLRGHWCSQCSGNKKLTIEKINEQYISKNIKCISSEYLGNKLKLNWICMICNHTFSQSKNSMDKDFIRCKGCFNLSQINKAISIIKDKGGKCLTKKYTKSFKMIKCICGNGHIFNITYSALVNAERWCSTCSESVYVSEQICKSYFESLFGEQFIKIRPKWLTKENGYRLELDGYCEKINLAFEHNGIFHYENIYNNLEITKHNDSLKEHYCKLNNVNLIIIPQLFNKTPLYKLREFILNECNLLNINVPFPEAKVDIRNCYLDNKLNECRKIAELKGGKCLSKSYLGSKEKLIWECHDKHKWSQFSYVIKKGHWCPVCANATRSEKRKKR